MNVKCWDAALRESAVLCSCTQFVLMHDYFAEGGIFCI